jgi:hypothetical protein
VFKAEHGVTQLDALAGMVVISDTERVHVLLTKQ